MDPTVAGLIVALQFSSRTDLLLVKTRLGWGLPVGGSHESLAELLTRVRNTLLAPGTTLAHVTGPKKVFDSPHGPVTYEMAITGMPELRDYLISDDWREVRWASLDEAWHVIQKDQDPVLRWCERGLKKSFVS